MSRPIGAILLVSVLLFQLGCQGNRKVARAWGFVNARAVACEAKADWVADRWPYVSLDESEEFSVKAWLEGVEQYAPAKALLQPTRDALRTVSSSNSDPGRLLVEVFGTVEALCAMADDPSGFSKLTFLQERATSRQRIEAARSRLDLLLGSEGDESAQAVEEAKALAQAAVQSERARLTGLLAEIRANEKAQEVADRQAIQQWSAAHGTEFEAFASKTVEIAWSHLGPAMAPKTCAAMAADVARWRASNAVTSGAKFFDATIQQFLGAVDLLVEKCSATGQDRVHPTALAKASWESIKRQIADRQSAGE